MLSLARAALFASLAGGTAAFAACAPSKQARLHATADAAGFGTDDPGEPDLPPPRPPDYNNPDSGALGAGERERDAAAPKPEGGARPGIVEAGTTPIDSGGNSGPAECPGALAHGDLAIVEFLIQSQAGTGDRGEWVEIQSTRSCSLNLRGLRIESPRTAGASDGVNIDYDLVIGPNETFLVADTTIADLNHHLPRTVLSWIATDALEDAGDTIKITAGGTAIDEVTYGSWGAHVGRSVSFPVDCAWNQRSDWSRWSWSFHAWGSATVSLLGTPNADNDDITCF